ncbi:hypothetical protein M728_006036 (plasmid) [Ensifer sp. WSM1721]
MRQQTKSLFVEIKQSRKPKANDRKTSIWGKLDLTSDQDMQPDRNPIVVSAAAGGYDRPLCWLRNGPLVGLNWLKTVQEAHSPLGVRRSLKDGPPIVG